MRTIYTSNKDLVATSLAAEEMYLKVLATISSSLDEQDLLSYGTDDMLATIADKHEEHIYLLKRRSS
jgi:bacterioferritin (cytochrome b1)